MLKKYYKVLQPLPLYSKGNVISFNVQTINYGEEQIDKRGIGTILAFMWEFKDYYLEEIVNDPDIGELPKEIFNKLKDNRQHDQFLNYEWCVIYHTACGYDIRGFESEYEVMYDLNLVADCVFNHGVSFYKCYHNKKEVQITHKVQVEIKEN
jgi:hypothetical protein